ncbi:hypothetical protein TNCV_4909941 [Trichonephila clavipes]|nr:hypothetical protein TNCV_4909941 [Trichonephila clavipes]
MDAMRLSIRLWGILFHSSKVQSQVSDGSRRPWSRSNGVVGACPKHARLDSGQESTLEIPRCICFSFKHVLHQTETPLCGRALSSWKTKESPMAPA